MINFFFIYKFFFWWFWTHKKFKKKYWTYVGSSILKRAWSPTGLLFPAFLKASGRLRGIRPPERPYPPFRGRPPGALPCPPPSTRVAPAGNPFKWGNEFQHFYLPMLACCALRNKRTCVRAGLSWCFFHFFYYDGMVIFRYNVLFFD